MRHLFLVTIVISMLFCFSGCGSNEATEESTEPTLAQQYADRSAENGFNEIETGKHLKVTVTDPGEDVFAPSKLMGKDYRYGPSIILNDDGSVDAWFSARGDGKDEFDWITYRHSDDGKAFSDEKVVLSPTPGSLDSLSTCDPDVFYYDGFYYLGYTSTMDDKHKGICNSVFLARSENPDGPYEKWDGEGFGGAPVPIICYDGVRFGWGLGEPSFVVFENTLYVYVTRDTFLTDYSWIRTTEVYTADITDEDWPLKLSYSGDAAVKINSDDDTQYIYDDCDSWDVAYVEEAEMFLALCVNRRMKDDSALLYFESEDGINFRRVSEINENVVCGANNCGLMSDVSGHIKKGDKMMAGYAYSGSGSSAWGVWATRFAPVSIEVTDRIDISEGKKSNLKEAFSYSTIQRGGVYMVNSETPLNSKALDEAPFKLGFYCLDSNYSKYYTDKSDITLTGLDENIVTYDNGVLWPKGIGMTRAVLGYKGVNREVCFGVMPQGTKKDEPIELFTIKDEYHVTMYRPYAVVIRPLFRLADYSIHELSDEEIVNTQTTYSVEDESIVNLWVDGTIYPVSPGTTTVTLTTGSGLSHTVKVVVEEPLEEG